MSKMYESLLLRQKVINRLGAIFLSQAEWERAGRPTHYGPLAIKVFPTIAEAQSAYEREYAQAENEIRLGLDSRG